MVALRHAALHAQEQQIVWQQIFIESREYVWRLVKVKLPPMKRTNPSKPKSRCPPTAASGRGPGVLKPPPAPPGAPSPALLHRTVAPPFQRQRFPPSWPSPRR